MCFIVNWFKRRGMATKQFLFLFFVTAALFSALAWTSLYEAEQLFQQQVTRDSQELIAQTNQFLNAYLDNVQNIILFLSTRQDLLEPGKQEEASRFLRKYRDVNRSIVKTLYYMGDDGTVFSDRQLVYDIVGNPHLTYLYQLAQETPYGINWSEPYESPLSGRTVAFVRPVMDEAHHIIGAVIVELDLERLTKRLMPLLSRKNQTFMVMTSGNHAVSTDLSSSLLMKDSRYPPRLHPSFLKQLGQFTAGVHEYDQGEKPLVVSKSHANRFGWRVLSIVDRQFYYKSIDHLYKNYRDMGLLWLLILLVSSLLISRYFTNPIRQLVTKMDQVKNVETLSGLDVNREDEIGKLADSFNAMMARVRQLIHEIQEAEERKKKDELKVLQSQIGPHFLYNTLACIGSLAKQGKMTEVRATIRALVGLLSFGFDKTTEFVTVAEELDSLRMYVQIQQVRYGKRFTMDIRVDEDVKHLHLFKLTLQPLVENAIFHGILPKKRPGKISIYGGQDGDRLRLYVRDDGVGMDHEQRVNVLTHQSRRTSQQGFNKIGMMNVHERLRMNFGDTYGLRVASQKGIGTIVRVTVPVVNQAS